MSCVLPLSAFLGDIFFSDFGIILYKTLVFTNAEPFLLPTDAHNVKNRRVIKTF